MILVKRDLKCNGHLFSIFFPLTLSPYPAKFIISFKEMRSHTPEGPLVIFKRGGTAFPDLRLAVKITGYPADYYSYLDRQQEEPYVH
jgi:hypothetical protein